MRHRALPRILLVALAIAAVVGHICSLPLRADAHASHPMPAGTPAEGSHDEGASCVAAAVPPPSHPIPATMLSRAPEPLAPPAPTSVLARPVGPRSSLPPPVHPPLRI
jgi:hypothetical protein